MDASLLNLLPLKDLTTNNNRDENNEVLLIIAAIVIHTIDLSVSMWLPEPPSAPKPLSETPWTMVLYCTGGIEVEVILRKGQSWVLSIVQPRKLVVTEAAPPPDFRNQNSGRGPSGS